VRASAAAASGDIPHQAAALMGFRDASGWAIAVVGVLLAAASIGWARRGVVKVALAAGTVAAIALVVLRLRSLNVRAADLAVAARRSPNFAAYHAGFGWGAWFLLLGAILAGFALLVGALRALDARRGIPG